MEISEIRAMADELKEYPTRFFINEIGRIGGPRCCKRDSFLSILSAIDFMEENFGVKMDKPEVVCDHSSKNNQCIGKRCPFAKINHGR